MKIKIGSMIKALRAKQYITQEQLATYLGVTPQAISRWESQAGYPDIEILPLIAQFFSVTVDTLLGINYDEKEARRQEIYQKIKQNDELGLGREVLDEARMFVAEFPADEKIQENLAVTICRAYMWDESPQLDKLAEAEKLYQTLIATTRDHNYRNMLLESLAYLYAVAYKDRIKLEQVLAQLPLMAYSRESVGANALWELDRDVTYTQDYIKKLTDALGLTLRHYITDCIDNAPEQWESKIAMLEQVIGLYRAVFGENMHFYHTRVSRLYWLISTYRVAQGKQAESLDCLEKMLLNLQMAQKTEPGDKYDSPFLSELEADTALPGMGEFDRLEVHNEAWYTLHEKMSHPRYDPLRALPRFGQIIDALTELAQ